eukprot:XP_014626121.1 uncharacterized protein LOC106796986 [Glycine max]
MFGFGYDPSSDKYKVVAIALTMLSLDVSEKTEMKVYGAGDSSWRNLKGFPVLWTLPKVGGVYLSGTLNWVVIKGKETIHSEIVHPPLPINCLLESLFGGLESENTCSRFWALADKYSRLFTNSCNPNALVAEMGYWVPSQTNNVIFRGTNGNWEAVLCGRMGSGKT